MSIANQQKKVWDQLGIERPYYAAVTPTESKESDSYILNSIPKNVRVLDAGCGWGRNATALKGERDVICLDFSIGMCMNAQSHGLNVVLADISHLPFRNECFDYVYSTLTLQHIPRKDLEKTLKEFKRVSKNIIFSLPNAEDLDAKIRSKKSREGRKQPDRVLEGIGWMLNYYTINELKTLCKTIFFKYHIDGQDYRFTVPKLGITFKNPLHITSLARNFIVYAK